VADAGIGIQAAALQFGLRFLPVVTESYYLACLSTNVRHPAIERLREILAGQRWQDILAGLPGYRLPDSPGRLLSLEEALPQLARGSGTLRRAHQP
jgi:molybdate-binding protein